MKLFGSRLYTITLSCSNFEEEMNLRRLVFPWLDTLSTYLCQFMPWSTHLCLYLLFYSLFSSSSFYSNCSSPWCLILIFDVWYWYWFHICEGIACRDTAKCTSNGLNSISSSSPDTSFTHHSHLHGWLSSHARQLVIPSGRSVYNM